MSDDDDDLAALRAARAARLGTAGLTVTAARRAAAASRGEGGGGGGGGGGGDGHHQEPDLRSHFPAGFGGGGAPSFDLGNDDGGDVSGGDDDDAPALRDDDDRGLKRGRSEEAEEEEEEEDDEDASDPFHLPITREVPLPPTPRGVAALALDRAGARLLAGARDGTLQIFDFGTMDAGLAPRRTFVPRPGHPITALAWAPSASAFLLAAGDPCLTFFDPDGRKRGETARGDPYLRDAKHTAGHTAPVTSAAWHPADAGTAASASEDGTVRLWDTEAAKQATVVKPTHARGGGAGARRVGVSALAYAGEGGALLVAGCEGGSLHAWDLRAGGGSGGAGAAGSAASVGGLVPPPREQMTVRPDWRVVAAGAGGGGVVERVATGAVAPGDGDGGGAVTALAADSSTGSGPRLAVRGGDGTLKVWDLRLLGPQGSAGARGGAAPAPTPLLSLAGLPADFPGTGVAWSPDGRLVVGAVSTAGGPGAAAAAAAAGALVFADTAAAASPSPIVRRLALAPGVSALALAWHRGLNQLFLGTGSPRSGGVVAFYSPTASVRGVAGAGRRPRRKADPAADWAAPLVIHAPHALAAFREDIPGLPKPRARRGAPAAGPPTAGPPPPAGAGGGRAAPARPARTLLTQHLLAGGGALRPAGAEADVREALLAHGAVGGGGGGPRVLAEEEEEEED